MVLDGTRAEGPGEERLFFALWPDGEVRRCLAAHAAACERRCRGRAVPTANLHLTLAFLGAVPAERRTCLEAAAARLSVPPFDLLFDRLGYFRRPQVVWIGCRDVPPAAAELVAQLQGAIAACGAIPDYRPFRAHVTLRRHARQGPPRVPIAPLPWRVSEFVLVRSHTLPEGARYDVVRRWPLATVDAVERG